MRLSRLPGRLGGRLVEVLRDRTGSVAATVAILSPVLIGAMGLGAETGYWYLKQRRIQNAADVAVHAAAVRLHNGDAAAGYTAMASYVAGRAEVDMGDAAITVNVPPTSGAFAGESGAVEVILTEDIPRSFSAVFEPGTVTVTGRSVAVLDGGGPGCIMALSATEQEAINVGGSANINLAGCDMVSNAAGISFDMDGGGGSVHARCIQTVGQAVTTNSLTVDCAQLREYAPPAPDPYAGVDEPVPNGICLPGNVGANHVVTNLSPIVPHTSGLASMRFCNGLTLRGDVNMAPGIYFIEGGDFRINAGTNVLGDGVVIYLADGVEMDFNGSAHIDLSAPTSGPYAGILVFGSRDATTMSHKINGDAGVIVDGAIYTPASHLDILGSAGTSAISCTQMIGNTLAFSGNGAININCTNTAGSDGHTGLRVVLVE